MRRARFREVFGISERRACRVLDQPRSTQRYEPMPAANEQLLTDDSVEKQLTKLVQSARRFGKEDDRDGPEEEPGRPEEPAP